jgi:hypothetical protein
MIGESILLFFKMPRLSTEVYIVYHLGKTIFIQNKNPWPGSASELYRPSDRRLLAKLVSTFVERGV